MSKQIHGDSLLQFPAGKMVLKDGVVGPDKRKGILRFVKNKNGVGMIWSSGTYEEEYKLPPGVKVSKVEKCVSGRVIVFDLGKEREPLFFWLQERSTDNDDVYLSEIQGLLAEARFSYERSTEELDKVLQRFVREASAKKEADVSLADIIGSKKVIEALREDSAFFMCALHQHLPEGTDPTSDILEQVRNPQVYAAAAALNEALRNPDGFRQLCTGFGVNATDPSVLSFIKGVMRMKKK